MNRYPFVIHTLDGQISTIYLVVYSDKILILDGGCRCDVSIITDYIKKKLHRNLSDVKLAVASHAHPDHGAGSPLLKKKYSIPVAAPKYINSWYKNTGGCIQHKIDTFLGYYVAVANKRPLRSLFYARRINYDYALSDGMKLPEFDDWRVIETPGHTSHDIVLYNEECKLLYAADVILRVNKKFLLPFPVPLRDSMENSLTRIGPLEVDRLLMAHGGAVEVDGIEELTDSLKSDLRKPLHPFLKKLILLENFSPEIKRVKKRETKF